MDRPILPTGGTGVMCGHCGMYHLAACPRIAEIDYYPDGTVKHVRYNPVTIAPQSSVKPPLFEKPDGRIG